MDCPDLPDGLGITISDDKAMIIDICKKEIENQIKRYKMSIKWYPLKFDHLILGHFQRGKETIETKFDKSELVTVTFVCSNKNVTMNVSFDKTFLISLSESLKIEDDNLIQVIASVSSEIPKLFKKSTQLKVWPEELIIFKNHNFMKTMPSQQGFLCFDKNAQAMDFSIMESRPVVNDEEIILTAKRIQSALSTSATIAPAPPVATTNQSSAADSTRQPVAGATRLPVGDDPNSIAHLLKNLEDLNPRRPRANDNQITLPDLTQPPPMSGGSGARRRIVPDQHDSHTYESLSSSSDLGFGLFDGKKQKGKKKWTRKPQTSTPAYQPTQSSNRPKNNSVNNTTTNQQSLQAEQAADFYDFSINVQVGHPDFEPQVRIKRFLDQVRAVPDQDISKVLSLARRELFADAPQNASQSNSQSDTAQNDTESTVIEITDAQQVSPQSTGSDSDTTSGHPITRSKSKRSQSKEP